MQILKSENSTLNVYIKDQTVNKYLSKKVTIKESILTVIARKQNVPNLERVFPKRVRLSFNL